MIVGAYTVNTVVELEGSMNSSPWKIIFTKRGPRGISGGIGRYTLNVPFSSTCRPVRN